MMRLFGRDMCKTSHEACIEHISKQGQAPLLLQSFLETRSSGAGPGFETSCRDFVRMLTEVTS